MDVCFFSQLPRGGTYAGNFLLAFDPVPKGTPLYSLGFITIRAAPEARLSRAAVHADPTWNPGIIRITRKQQMSAIRIFS